MNYTYQGSTPIDVGDTVEVYGDDGEAREGQVLTVLAVQFRVRLPRETARFLFYADRGVTWQLVSKGNTLPLKRNVLHFPELAEHPTY